VNQIGSSSATARSVAVADDGIVETLLASTTAIVRNLLSFRHDRS
jgi:hypothetical protein